MNFTAPHIGFVIAAYAIAVVVIGTMVIGTLVDARSLRKSLERVETRARPTRGSKS